MGILSRSADLYYTYKFLRLLTTSWTDTDAYKLGIIDKNGKVLIKPSEFTTNDQKDAYTYFDRLVFNIKRLMGNVPGGSSKIASYAAALFLIRENFGLTDSGIQECFNKMDINIDKTLSETTTSWYILGNNDLAPGSYTLSQNIALPSTGEISAKRGTRVVVDEACSPVGSIFNETIYKVKHCSTKQDIFVTAMDLIR
jgi:hypothetical protein